MREFLFRGKRKDNGEWIIRDNIAKCAYEVDDETKELIEVYSYYLNGVIVDAKTVGQYTGVTDKNDNRIFEGDIVMVNVKGHNTVCTVSWAETVAHFQLWQVNTLPHTATNLNLGNYDCEIIGNIHDNPELMEGGVAE